MRCWDTTWFAYALQADYSWGDPTRPLEAELSRFTDSFAATFYGARDQQTVRVIASAYRELDAVKSDLERNNYLIRDIIGEYDIHDASYVDNSLEASLGLIDELAAHPKGPGKTLGDIRRRCENALNVSASFRQKLAGTGAHVQNTYSLHYLVSAAHKMENHAERTLFLLEMAEAFQKRAAAKDSTARRALQPMFAELQKRCEVLQADTRLITDELDELAHGAVGQLIWEGAGTEKVSLATAADTTGYHKVLASLAGFQKRIQQAADAGQP